MKKQGPTITWLAASESSLLEFKRFVGGRGIRTLPRVNTEGTDKVGVKDGKGMPVMYARKFREGGDENFSFESGVGEWYEI